MSVNLEDHMQGSAEEISRQWKDDGTRTESDANYIVVEGYRHEVIIESY